MSNQARSTPETGGQVHPMVMCDCGTLGKEKQVCDSCQGIGGKDKLIEKPATLEEWKAKAEALWILIDDIDTAGDMFKPEITAYFKYVNRKASERHSHMQSDGYLILNT